MAEVFKAIDSRSGEIVALKRMLPSLDDEEGSEDLTPLFQAEARIGATLRHPHIAQLLDFGRVGEFFYITFEFIDGRDLSAIQAKLASRGERMPVELACALVLAVADALSYAHDRRDAEGNARPVVHRDVSPQNILVGHDGRVRLIDFGVAKDVEGGGGRTQIGNVRGKFGYLAPEQVDGDAVDGRTDTFGLAVVLWELVAGARLFHADNEFLAVQRLKNHTPEPLDRLRPEVPAAVAEVVASALSKAPSMRPGTMASFRDALRNVSGVASGAGHEHALASLMERLFSDSHSHVGAPPSSKAVLDSKVVEEKRSMSADEKQGGKQDGEVDVFEALSQKRRSLPPPAPSGANLKGTMLGVPNPLASVPVAAPAPPPPSTAVAKAPEPVVLAPAAPAVEWEEDEDEATHVFDKSSGDAASLMAVAFQQQTAAKKEADAPAPEVVAPTHARTLFGVAAPIVVPPPATAPVVAPPPATDVAPPSSYALIHSASVPVGAPNPLMQTAASPSVPPAAFAQPAPTPSQAPPYAAGAVVASPAATNWGLIGGLAAVIVAAGVFLAMPKHGKLVVNLADSRGEAVPAFDVLLDGEPLCSALPCIGDKLSIGTKTISVQATGFKKPAPKTVNIENGKTASVDFTLTADTPAPTRVAEPLAMAAAPIAAPIAAPVPAPIPAPMPAPSPVAAPPAPTAVTPPKAAPAPFAAPPVVASKVPTTPAPAPAPAPTPAPAPKAAPAPAAATPTATASVAGMGTLTINSLPASTVKVDGRSVGSTPVTNLAVKAGKHTIVFENAEEGLTKTLEVEVSAGETKKAIAKLRSE